MRLIVFLTAFLSAGVQASALPTRLTFAEDMQAKAISADQDDLIYSGDLIFYAKDVRSGAVVIRKWPNGRLPIVFSAEVGATERAMFQAACDDWGQGSAIRCVPRGTEAAYLIVTTHSGDRCDGFPTSCSFVGMQGAGQLFAMYAGQWSDPGVIRHELGHAIGLIHEQQRSDRDHFVTINYANIEPTARRQFDKVSSATPVTDYDYISIMHYPRCAWSVHPCTLSTEDTQTIVPRACHVSGEFGGNVISAADRQGIQSAYGSNLASVFKPGRTSKCGVRTYSPAQVRVLCGDQCSAAGGVSYIRKETVEESWCGGLVAVDPPELTCLAIRKDYIRHWWDQDSCSCGVCQTRHERWTECGCAKQELTTQCTSYQQLPLDSAIEDLVELDDDIDRRSAKIMKYLKKLDDKRQLDPELANRVVPFFLENRSIDKASRKFLFFNFRIRLAVTWGRLKNRNNGLTIEKFTGMARASNLDTDALEKASSR